MLNRSGEAGYLYFVLSLMGKAFSLSSWSMMLAVEFFGRYSLLGSGSFLLFLVCCIFFFLLWTGLEFYSCFFCFKCYDHVVFLFFSLGCSYGRLQWFLDIAPAFHSWINPLGPGVSYLLQMAGSGLLTPCWGFLCLCPWGKLGLECCVCPVLVSG